jgi:hypothetical protein
MKLSLESWIDEGWDSDEDPSGDTYQEDAPTLRRLPEEERPTMPAINVPDGFVHDSQAWGDN